MPRKSRKLSPMNILKHNVEGAPDYMQRNMINVVPHWKLPFHQTSPCLREKNGTKHSPKKVTNYLHIDTQDMFVGNNKY